MCYLYLLDQSTLPEASAFERDTMLTNYMKVLSTVSLSSCQISRKEALFGRRRCFTTIQGIENSSSRRNSNSSSRHSRVLFVRSSSSSSNSSRATGLDIVSPLIGLSGAIWNTNTWMLWPTYKNILPVIISCYSHDTVLACNHIMLQSRHSPCTALTFVIWWSLPMNCYYDS